ncbi:MAG: hypothetical protein ABI234_01870 [Ktedonobacteraceae bacterium]
MHTPAVEVAQALLMVMRRGSLRATEEITGHTYETPLASGCGGASEHAEALTAVLTQHLHLSTVEIDAFWSCVQKNSEPDEADAGARWGCLVTRSTQPFHRSLCHGTDWR